MSSSNSSAAKRKQRDSISPPPVKRKVQSGTTIANFFKPASQKPKDRTIWTERAPNEDTPATLLVGRYEPENPPAESKKRTKVAAFDLDSTLITTASGKKHSDDGTDWKWWHASVPGRLRELYNDEGYRVVVLSNQAGLVLHPDPKAKGPKSTKDRVSSFKQKVNAVLTQLDIPTTIYAATEKDIYRKPRPGMWKELCEDYDISDEVDLEHSVFVGDAGGRIATVKSAAHNIGIDYKTPEEFFLDEEPRDFVREFDVIHYSYPEESKTGASDVLFEKKNKQDIVICCGPPGAGKSTFFWNHLKPLGYERINQDILKTRDKCVQAAKEILSAGQSVAIDNTNADPDTRAVWVQLAEKQKVPIRCVWLKTPLTHNPECRVALPKMAFNGFKSRFKEPKQKEGFQDITEIEFAFRGTKEEHDTWAKYWL
ncbi:Bifunctional polynucleotide phosphatase/kinase [Colletotrichum sp. SAR 10_70]|nr:Bifunctional polynucleotide phosphatase/kinase [Colletotrichum sp. SAR 10_71]KAI8171376.1 Bifunctional polynucleotide phosphatase/kinase [Colletotrichum sp. SAR 10_70]KAI8175346.1 Bifunctional polynucleotide phosphatase/kinase [Colletotrichum sp. SAR 10_65]KAI8178188.1 Bifunctional polynucleotide phosphatase/kinase [Colletotrichum sp. SAR 10_75]KAI8204195.1 Bifunctional polynucleotide phosphatase/kinase [Colletotrichum sp. SAR 10_76]KAI8224872.1 Bifunctional polynucleotide phosphatase/kinas